MKTLVSNLNRTAKKNSELFSAIYIVWSIGLALIAIVFGIFGLSTVAAVIGIAACTPFVIAFAGALIYVFGGAFIDCLRIVSSAILSWARTN